VSLMVIPEPVMIEPVGTMQVETATAPQTASDVTTETEARTVEGVKVVEVAEPPKPEIVLPVYYDAVFEEYLKPEFEKDVLVKLAEGKEFTLVSVSKGTDEVVSVEMSLKDGTTQKKFYLKSAVGIWNEVRYVERYYFDDSFEYVRSFDDSPATFNPYQYPYLHR
jgi:hypothetical protein